jgi:Flp pilus assembly protein TadG
MSNLSISVEEYFFWNDWVESLLHFVGSRNGNVAMIFALLLAPLILVCGAAIDIARHEVIRVELQDGLDRGVLAAASLTQTKDTDLTVKEYLKNLAYLADVKLAYQSTVAINARKVKATATYPMKTAFLSLIGITSLNVGVVSVAEEARQNIELSLMLDMSGSMETNDRIGKLRTAAKSFIDTLLTTETKDYTTISIVPYAGEVSVGATMFDKLGGTRKQSTNSCFELDAANYGASAPTFAGRAQVPLFTNWNFNKKTMNWWWCPTDDTSISYLSNDATYLKSRITSMKMHDGTGTQNAMQWGFMLLDPNSSTIVQTAVAAGLVQDKFKARPAAFNDTSTMKFIVLMTDGAITEQYRPKDVSRDPFTLAPDNKNVLSAANAVTRFNSVCAAAKAKGITVFTIGFEVSGAAVTQMTNCASSAAHFYPVSGTGINDAFKSISTTIRKLRLTQ